MLVGWTKGGEIVWRGKATLLCAKTKRSRHEQDTRHQPLSPPRLLLRLIGERGICPVTLLRSLILIAPEPRHAHRGA
jgi:hypothetical protein